MVDITLAILINMPTHSFGEDIAKEARRLREFDVIEEQDISNSELIKGKYRSIASIDAPRIGLVHIIGMSAENTKTSVLSDGIEDVSGVILRRCGTRVSLPAANITEIYAEKETTWTMPPGKDGVEDEIDIIQRKTIVDNLDATKDTLTKIKNKDMR